MPDISATPAGVLLDLARLPVDDEERARFVAIHPALRAQADSLFVADLAGEEPVLAFDPTAAYG